MSVYVCAGCGKRQDEPNHAPSCPMYREPPVPDFRDLARRLAEALEIVREAFRGHENCGDGDCSAGPEAMQTLSEKGISIDALLADADAREKKS